MTTMKATHRHTCPVCGRMFHHENRSVMNCPGKNEDWRCNPCVVQGRQVDKSKETRGD